MNDKWSRAALLPVALCFIAGGLLFIPRLGIEVDEAIVTNGIYPNGAPWYSWKIGGAEIPVMLISYLGALKTWMYSLLFLAVPPRPMSLRLPTLLLAAGSLWLFFGLLDRALSRRAAWTGTLLLATDTSYLLMNTVDYGPVTLQFVLKFAALLALVRFHQNGGRAFLSLGFFLLGVAMWDKAVFAWVLFGFAAGALAAFPGAIRAHLSLRNLGTAAASMILGALPFLIYNVARPLETVRSNAQTETLAVWGKSIILTRTMTGEVFFGFLTAFDSGPTPGEPQRWYQSASVALANVLGHPRSSLMLWATGAAVISLAVLWRTPARRPILFSLVAGTVTWLSMALTAGAGAAAQHVILIWPLHIVAIAAAINRVPMAAAIAITAILCGANAAVTNEYYATLLRNGPSLRWTDAMDPLHSYLSNSDAPRVYIADWGILETMNLLSEGTLPVQPVGLAGDAAILGMLQDSRALFVAHPREIAIHPRERAAVEEIAAREHYLEEPVATIRDRNGRPAFDVFRFRKLHL